MDPIPATPIIAPSSAAEARTVICTRAALASLSKASGSLMLTPPVRPPGEARSGTLLICATSTPCTRVSEYVTPLGTLRSASATCVHGVMPLMSGAGAVSSDTRVLEGFSADEIVDHARDEGFDLIVMGTHGRRGLAHVVLGSVAERVLRSACCPVLTVRLPSAP